MIPVYDAGEEDGLLYIAMRYVEGTDLRKLIAEARAGSSRRAAAGIVAQVGGGARRRARARASSTAT